MQVYNFEQRGPEWYKIREGKLTASKITNVLGSLSTAKCAGAIDNKAMVMAIESVHGMIERDYINFDLQRGIDQEPSAFALLSELLSKEFLTLIKVGFVEVNEHVGCSPDGIIEGLNVPTEIKCPDTENFFKLVLSQKIKPEYHAQIQQQIRCLDAPYGVFFAYCVHKGKEYYYLQKVERKEDTIKLIKEREELIIGKKLAYIKDLKSRIVDPYNGYIVKGLDKAMIVENLSL